MMNKGTSALIFVAVVAVSSSIYSWYMPQPVITKTEYVRVPEIKETVRIKRVEVLVEKIVTIEKEVVVRELNLPDWIKNDKDIQVIATASIEPYEGTTDAVATMNTQTGEGMIVAKHRSLRLIPFENRKEIGVRYGATIAGPEVDVYAQWQFLRVGSTHLGLYVDANTHSDARAMVQVGYRF